MTTLILIIAVVVVVVVVVVVILFNSFVIIPEYHFGVMSVLGARKEGKKGILEEGWHLLIPFVSSYELNSLKLVSVDIEFSFTTKDKMNLVVEGVVQYRPNPGIWFPEGHPDYDRNVFVTVSEEVITAGIVELVETRIGGIGGRYSHTVFIESRQALGDILNAALRLSESPHQMHKHGCGDPDPMNPDDPFCGQSNCEYDGPVKAGELIEFYDLHWPQIAMLRANEEVFYRSHSRIEARYGINVRSFDLGDVAFTPETQKAFEAEKQAEAREKAGKLRIKIARKFKKKVGVSPQTAVDESDLLLDPEVTKKVVSIQGEAGPIGAALGSFASKGGA